MCVRDASAARAWLARQRKLAFAAARLGVASYRLDFALRAGRKGETRTS